MASNARNGPITYPDHDPRNPDTSAAEAAIKARLSRKRTKTGCLTCRKRRIKCGEERPVCKNCMKSKRQCEGYNQRVVFKQPAYDYQPISDGGANVTFQAGPVPGPLVAYDRQYDQAIGHASFHAQPQAHSRRSYDTSLPAIQQPYANGASSQGNVRAAQSRSLTDTPKFQVAPSHTHATAPHHVDRSAVAQSQPQSQFSYVQAERMPTVPPSQQPAPSLYRNVFQASSREHHANGLPLYPIKHESQLFQSPLAVMPNVDYKSPASSASSKTLSWSQTPVAEPWSAVSTAFPQVTGPELPHPPDLQIPQLTAQTFTKAAAPLLPTPERVELHASPELYEYEQQFPAHNSMNNFLSQAAVELQDDDYFDVDEEMDIDTLAVAAFGHERQQSLQKILQINNISVHDLQPRRYDTFLYDGILDHYRVEDAANPLKNPATARVFAHFISVTAPCLSVFERHPRNASVLFTSGQIPLSQRGLWTYTMPIAALHHQGLLHSMLALASLHIARLQNASDTPSRQHYAWACKRINHLLGPKSKKRHKTTTIAASMLLGFYEIFTADHRAWNLHLTGSKQLFLETDFLTLSRQFRELKLDRAARQHVPFDTSFAWTDSQTYDEILDQVHDVDDKTIGILVGKHVDYSQQAQALEPQTKVPPALDLTYFEILRDLYWWYLKQDAYQSIISGNPLLLNFSRWPNCPPRAPLGRADAVYGSFDHLMLLLGRIADFASRDRKRKLRQMEANGGEWRPAPGTNPSQTQGVQRSQPHTPLTPAHGQGFNGDYFNARPPPQTPIQPSQPQFYGMAPPPRTNVQMPSAYYPTNRVQTPQPTSPQEDIDLRAATNAALEEYGRIRAALREFESRLGEGFEPLSEEYQLPLETPFGNALFYRSYDIGCLWAIYYMAVIIAIRSHPHMHPAAHAAAAISSHETAFYAQEIGRINAGIVPGPPEQPLNPTLGAALTESCIPAFFAAIQYKSPQQRHATVMRIHNIGVRTGWGTAETIANGCETAWVKAAAAGRGPPYTRIVRQEHSEDPRLNGRSDRLDPNGLPSGEDDQDRRLVKTKADARLTWAIGILGMESDEQASVGVS